MNKHGDVHNRVIRAILVREYKMCHDRTKAVTQNFL